MGVGDSLEAAYRKLHWPIPAGDWNLSGDGVVVPAPGMGMATAEVRWDILFRAAPDGGSERLLASFSHLYKLDANNPFNAVAFQASTPGPGADPRPGDALVLRITVTGGDPGVLFEPNGDGAFRAGRIPHLTLPQ